MTDTPVPAARPFKPRPVLFALLLVLMAAWIGLMLWMYFKTVYPHRHAATPAASGQQAVPSEER